MSAAVRRRAEPARIAAGCRPCVVLFGGNQFIEPMAVYQYQYARSIEVCAFINIDTLVR
jgi:hypothetical protein